MHFRLGTICLTSVALVCGISLTSFAYEAPVVSADSQQQSDSDGAASTQADSSSTNGGGWQQMSSNDGNNQNASSNSSNSANNSGGGSEQGQGWETVRPQNNGSNAENSAPRASAQPGSMNARVGRLEQQMSNYAQMNMPQQISDLHQKVAQLEGQVQTDQRELQTLTNQQKLYYQDLSQQMAQLKQKDKMASNEVNKPSQSNQSDDMAKKDTGASATVAENDLDSTAEQKMQKDEVASKPKHKVHAKKHEASWGDTAATTQASNQSNTLKLPNQPGEPQLGDADAYGKAFRLLSSKHFDEADAGFQKYLQNYPQGQFAVNAHFWLGEIAMMNQHFDVASKQFQTVVSQYPKSDKVPDAKLKIAMIHAAMGKTNIARKEFEEIRKAYPGTTAAQLASIRLQQLANATSVTMQ